MKDRTVLLSPGYDLEDPILTHARCDVCRTPFAYRQVTSVKSYCCDDCRAIARHFRALQRLLIEWGRTRRGTMTAWLSWMGELVRLSKHVNPMQRKLIDRPYDDRVR